MQVIRCRSSEQAHTSGHECVYYREQKLKGNICEQSLCLISVKKSLLALSFSVQVQPDGVCFSFTSSRAHKQIVEAVRLVVLKSHFPDVHLGVRPADSCFFFSQVFSVCSHEKSAWQDDALWNV